MNRSWTACRSLTQKQTDKTPVRWSIYNFEAYPCSKPQNSINTISKKLKMKLSRAGDTTQGACLFHVILKTNNN